MALSVLTQAILVPLVSGFAAALWLVCRRAIRILTSPLRDLPGPPPVSFWNGNYPQLFDPHGWAFHHDIVERYGGAVRIQGLCGDEQVYVSDPKALYHIVVKDQYIYEETEMFTMTARLCFGEGLLATVGERHKKQRKMLNPLFSINHMRALTPIFYKITHQLHDALARRVRDAPQEVDMLNWLSRGALECIGQGGLGYSFDSLADGSDGHPYSTAIKNLIPVLFSLSILRQFLPWLSTLGPPALRRWIVTCTPLRRVQRLRAIVDVMHRTSAEVLARKRAALAAGDAAALHEVGEGKDMMSVLLKANIAAAEEDRLSETELLGQMSTFIFAAQDTTSAALARTLHILAQHPAAQARLRTEAAAARAAHGGDIPYDALHALPFLDAVCRETLRLHPPVVFLHRTTRAATVLPLAQPLPPAAPGGAPRTALPLRAGTNVVIAIQAANRARAVWGADAAQWRPERWLAPLPASVADAHLPGVYSSMMTFLGGGRACIGFKFSQLEMKIMLATLVASFHFELSDKSIEWRLGGIVTPSVGGVPQLPLRVSLAG